MLLHKLQPPHLHLTMPASKRLLCKPEWVRMACALLPSSLTGCKHSAKQRLLPFSTVRIKSICILEPPPGMRCPEPWSLVCMRVHNVLSLSWLLSELQCPSSRAADASTHVVQSQPCRICQRHPIYCCRYEVSLNLAVMLCPKPGTCGVMPFRMTVLRCVCGHLPQLAQPYPSKLWPLHNIARALKFQLGLLGVQDP